MKKSIRAGVAGAAATIVLALGMQTTASANPPPPNPNQVEYWCPTGGVKIEPATTPFVVPPPPGGFVWTLLVLKAANEQSTILVNETFPSPVVGQAYSRTDGKDISHVILCKAVTTTTTTGATTTEATTTTAATTTIATTTTAATTTTGATTTGATTTVPVTTTNPGICCLQDTTTTTTVAATTTAAPTTTVTPTTAASRIAEVPVAEEVTPVPAQATPELPVTGLSLFPMFLIGVLSLSLGLALYFGMEKLTSKS